MSDEVLFHTAHDMILMARRNMVQDAWDYVCGAAESETSLRRNRMAIDSLALRPRVCRDVSEIDTSCDLLGVEMRIPVFLAPMGSIQNFSSNGALDVDTAAEEFGVQNFISTVTQPELEVIGDNTPHPKNFQIYVRGDDNWIKDLIKRVKASNYNQVTLTVDSAFYGNRERLSPTQLALRRVASRDWQKKITWDTVKMVKDEIDGRPFFLKGIQTGEDAAIAVEHGVDAIYISNHGGRQLDHVLGNMDMLPEIVEAVDGKASIVIDGGFTRGTDIIKALALGADAVGIGRLQAWALGAAGAPGLVHCLTLLEREITTCMGLIGVTSLDQLDPSYVTKAPWVRLPHEHSAFPHLDGPIP
jgi:isopentenyl diphosphate isomerase/L-lactate dehydrogenase-like FMN-dependent dehydrogenase